MYLSWRIFVSSMNNTQRPVYQQYIISMSWRISVTLRLAGHVVQVLLEVLAVDGLRVAVVIIISASAPPLQVAEQTYML